MSVRAYRLNSINYEESESFNLSHNDKLMDFLEGYGFYDQLNGDGAGVIEFSVTVIKEAVTKNIGKEIKKQLKKDIKWAKEHDVEYLTYYCF